MELEQLIEKYKALRDEKASIMERMNTEIAEVQDLIFAALNAVGAKSIKTDAGTAYTSVRRTASVKDWQAFSMFAADHPELVKESLDTTMALAMVDDGVDIPGVSVASTFVLSVR